MKNVWLPIRYRDFYDFPRAFVVEHAGELLLFDCPFNQALDDYGGEFSVYKIDADLRALIDTISWTDLGNRSELIGAVATGVVEFDETKRRAINADVLGHIETREARKSQ